MMDPLGSLKIRYDLIDGSTNYPPPPPTSWRLPSEAHLTVWEAPVETIKNQQKSDGEE